MNECVNIGVNQYEVEVLNPPWGVGLFNLYYKLHYWSDYFQPRGCI